MNPLNIHTIMTNFFVLKLSNCSVTQLVQVEITLTKEGLYYLPKYITKFVHYCVVMFRDSQKAEAPEIWMNVSYFHSLFYCLSLS